MANLKYVRADISEKEKNEILQNVINGKMTNEEAAAKFGVSVDDFRNVLERVRASYGTGGYGNDVQKLISYKGTIREMHLTAKNAKGGTYPLKVVNIYVKPNTERYYEEGVYSVDKDAIRTGTKEQGYNPDAALWSKTPKATPRTETSQMRRKRRSKTIAKRRKTVKSARRK
jgi:hypothetical protein